MAAPALLATSRAKDNESASSASVCRVRCDRRADGWTVAPSAPRAGCGADSARLGGLKSDTAPDDATLSGLDLEAD